MAAMGCGKVEAGLIENTLKEIRFGIRILGMKNFKYISIYAFTALIFLSACVGPTREERAQLQQATPMIIRIAQYKPTTTPEGIPIVDVEILRGAPGATVTLDVFHAPPSSGPNFVNISPIYGVVILDANGSAKMRGSFNCFGNRVRTIQLRVKDQNGAYLAASNVIPIEGCP